MKKIIFAIAIGIFFANCNNNNSGSSISTKEIVNEFEIKNHSYSNYQDVTPSHLEWNAVINFDKKELQGIATWHFKNTNNASKIILDINALRIGAVEVNGKKVEFKISEPFKYLGSALSFNINKDDSICSITYIADTNSTAIQWLTPAQTAGKKLPYLFTQCEAISARSLVPCWDAPAVRITYNAHLQVPVGMMAVMSAKNPTQNSVDGKYDFVMDTPIPTYLIALAVGDIAYQPINAMCGVYAEPSVLPGAAKELSDIPQMIAAAEKLAGPYRWGKYDVLVQPPSFPIGGMENPKLTFATPTILAGDKSLVSLIAHELAHSWSGNTVTNANWNDLWLNEGFTTYFERRIMENLKGKEYVDMLWELSYQDMQADIKDLGATSLDTRLKVNVNGRDPEDGFSNIPYEKGAHFLWLIEKTVGRENFDKVMVKYFNNNAFKPMTTEMALQFLDENLFKDHADWKKTIDIDAWVFGPGIPANCPRPGDAKFKYVDSVRNDFLKTNSITKTDAIANWSTHEWLQFLRKLPRNISIENMQKLDGTFNLTETKNSEIAFEWYMLSLNTNYTKAYNNIGKFLTRVGRKKFVKPIYTEMLKGEHKTDEQSKLAKSIFENAKQNYHPATMKAVQELFVK
jgi:leukotriene-A4 hydrolase